MVLKPSEIAPMSSILFAEIMHEAGVLPVYSTWSMATARGSARFCPRIDIDVVSFTGSTRAGILINKAAADTVKTVSLELGRQVAEPCVQRYRYRRRRGARGELLLRERASPVTPPRVCLSKRDAYERAVEVAAATAEATVVDLPSKSGGHIGPLVSQVQFDKVQSLIQAGIDEGARLVAGGTGRPEGLNRAGSRVRPSLPMRHRT